MRCRTAEHYISMKLDNELTNLCNQKLDRHLARCASCNALLEETRKLQNNLHGQADVDYPAWMHQRIMHNLPKSKARTWVFKPSFAYAGTALAVAFSLYMGTLAGIRGFQDSGYYSQNPQEQYLQLSFGENSLMELYDE